MSGGSFMLPLLLIPSCWFGWVSEISTRVAVNGTVHLVVFLTEIALLLSSFLVVIVGVDILAIGTGQKTRGNRQ